MGCVLWVIYQGGKTLQRMSVKLFAPLIQVSQIPLRGHLKAGVSFSFESAKENKDSPITSYKNL